MPCLSWSLVDQPDWLTWVPLTWLLTPGETAQVTWQTVSVGTELAVFPFMPTVGRSCLFQPLMSGDIKTEGGKLQKSALFLSVSGLRLWPLGSHSQGLSLFLAAEPRGCPQLLSHTVGMSESPIGSKPTMLRADVPTTRSFQQAFASSCTISSNGPGQRRER